MTDYCQRCGKRIESYAADCKIATVEVLPFAREWRICLDCAQELVDVIRECMGEGGNDG